MGKKFQFVSFPFSGSVAYVRQMAIQAISFVTSRAYMQYTNLTNEALTGTVNTVTNTIHFDDVYKNGTLDGQYNGTFTGDGMDAFEGTYENYTTKKQVNFSFKKAKADVEN